MNIPNDDDGVLAEGMPDIVSMPPAGPAEIKVAFRGDLTDRPYVVGIVYARGDGMTLSQSVQMAPDARAAIDRMEGVVAEKWGAAAGHRVMASSFAIANHGDICRL